MKILVIGSGGREHALVWKIRQSARVTKIYCSPGNPGIAELAECLPMTATACEGLRDFALKEHIALTIVGPEQPLADGIVDMFEASGLNIFGPSRNAAQLEWSKAFAKEFMGEFNIPTAAHRSFSKEEMEAAKSYVISSALPLVLKADGLAAGKGVVVCATHEQALNTLSEMIGKRGFGIAGERIVIEEFLDGEEASVFAICDGEDFVTLAPAQDHKRIFDGDRGKNTGGMGAYAPTPIVTPDLMQEVERQIIVPTLRGMKQMNRPYKGCLYIGLMITASGPKVVEYNCRFGDPEAQVVLPLYGGDIVELFEAACTKNIAAVKATEAQASNFAVCVVLASMGYPDEYPTGIEIDGLDGLKKFDTVIAFHAGTKMQKGRLATAGGRVFGITSRDANLARAIDTAYRAVGEISFAGMQFRRDIGRKAFVH